MLCPRGMGAACGFSAITFPKKRDPQHGFRVCGKNLAATYSRGSYTTTTIGKAAFDGRVRDGIGSDHSFMATKKYKRTTDSGRLGFPENYTQTLLGQFIRELKSLSIEEKRSSRTTD